MDGHPSFKFHTAFGFLPGSCALATCACDTVYRTYIFTTGRVTSGELLKYLNGLLIA
jgi:hypothetical protein